MNLFDGEPEITTWRRESVGKFASELKQLNHTTPLVIAIDSRSGGGKTTLARHLAQSLPATVVSTDNFAWWHSYFDWAEMLIANALEPLRAGRSIDYRPEAWIERDRPGSIKAEPADFIVVEGVGAAQAAMRGAIDVIIWVQADAAIARERGLARDLAERSDPQEAMRFWDEWMQHENPFQATQRTWEVADYIVLGTATPAPDPDTVFIAEALEDAHACG